MESAVDSLLDNIFGGVISPINIIFGVLLIIIGIAIFFFSKGKESKKPQTIGWILIAVGLLGILSGTFQSLLS
ncbi:hypothetical protein [Stomatohabitans albus]|uniref:hypothetical protein n=1 Tax=Stomatohabitans albus TaxID=3110766 RepID=UPI00300C0BC4